MKTLWKITLSLVVSLLFVPMLANAQINYNDPRYAKYGADETTRKQNFENYAFFREAMKMNSYADAEKRLAELIKNCPEATETIYHLGIQLQRTMIENAEDNATKFKHIEELLKLYDLRIKYFGKVRKVDGKDATYCHLSNKAKEVIQQGFLWNEKEDFVISTVDKVVKDMGANMDPGLALVYFKTVTDRFLADATTADLVLSEYDKMTNAIAQSSDQAKYDSQKTLDMLLINSGAASCENLEAIFKPQYEKNPNNIELITKIMKFLTRNDCESDFKTKLSTEYYRLKPSASAAYALATTFVAKKDMTSAVKYFREAVAREADNATRSGYESKLAATLLMMSDYKGAAEMAKKSITSDPRNGLGHFFLAQAYAIGSTKISSDDAFMKRAVYWLVVDEFREAKRLLPDNSSQCEQVDKAIRTYSAHYPTKEETFFKELSDGDTFKVTLGWITGTTKVRHNQ